MNWYKRAQLIPRKISEPPNTDKFKNLPLEQRLRKHWEQFEDPKASSRWQKALEPTRRGTYTATTESQLQERQFGGTSRQDTPKDYITEHRLDADPKLYIDRRPPYLVDGEPPMPSVLWRIGPFKTIDKKTPDTIIEKRIKR